MQNVFRKMRGKAALSERDVDEALREVRLVLLEADVNFRVVKDFVARVRDRAVGQEVLHSLTPAQHVIKVVSEELAELLGAEPAKLKVAAKPPTVIMVSGLHGSGKTTTVAKLANLFKKQGKNPLLLDSKAPSLPLDKYIYNETRYTMLVRSNPEAAIHLLASAEADLAKRWKLHAYLASMPGNGQLQEAIAQEVKK